MIKSILFAAVLTLLAGSAIAADFRCPNGTIVSTGNSISVVSGNCDSPTNKTRRSESEEIPGAGGRVRYIEIEEWTYNLGRNSLVHYLTFRDGALISISTGSYGK